jgi:hypothetical protein
MARIDVPPDTNVYLWSAIHEDDDGEISHAVKIRLLNGKLQVETEGDETKIDYEEVFLSFINTLNTPIMFKSLNDVGHEGIDTFLKERHLGLQ